VSLTAIFADLGMCSVSNEDAVDQTVAVAWSIVLGRVGTV